jgi:hypothetical protein
MNINLDNYEAYFLDYHEGSLSPALVKELMEFIAKHPELKQDFESFEIITVKDDERITFEQKQSLKKQQTKVNTSNFDEYAIDYIEGNLPLVLQQELKTFITQNPTYKKELELYSKIKLQPDTSIVFDDKHSLKRGQKRPAAWYYWSAAASVALIIVAYFMLNKNGIPRSNTVVKNEQSTKNNLSTKLVTKQSNTSSIAAHNIPNAPVNNTNNSNAVLVNRANMKHYVNGFIAPNRLNNGSPGIVVNRITNNIHLLPDLMQKPIPLFPENIFAVSSNNLQDTALINSLIVKYHSNAVAQQEDTIAEPYKEKSGGKFLFLLAKITCKGLHKITGEHIKMEKKFDADTTSIIAYQLDLGRKKFDFPVKE